MQIMQQLPYELAQEFGVVPLAVEGDVVAVATAPHMSVAALAAARQRLGRPLRTQAVDAERFRELITKTYATTRPANASGALNTRAEPDKTVGRSDSPATDLLATDAGGEDSPAVRIVTELLREALSRSASDIHLDATDRGGRVRFRIDGVLMDVRETDAATHASLVARCKVMAVLDIAERRLPQDGRMQVVIAAHKVDIRLATLATQHGERLVLRLLDTSASRLRLEGLGLTDQALGAMRRAVRMPHGLVLVTGPTGSGKTTTLYAAVSELDRERLNVVSVEDPVEYALDRVAQTQVNPRIDLSFARTLRSILRHDPDVIIVGEIRDRETAEIAIQASLTGHLVLASLHTNTAGAAITRLVDMGVEPYLLASSLRGVLAQRLVRKLCTTCRQRRPATSEEIKTISQLQIARSGMISSLYEAATCDDCNGTGYRGRQGLYRWLPIEKSVAHAIHARAPDTELEQLGVAAGWPELASDAARYLGDGTTSLSEVLRVVTS
jgi:general secretion pathway protein E